MPVIRCEQMKALEQSAALNFEDKMVVHCCHFAKRHCEAIGEENVRSVIRHGMERSRRYDLTNRGPVRFYIEMMFMFGSSFDTDPQLPWVEEILSDPRTRDQMQRAQRLYAKTREYLARVVGRNNEYAIESLRTIRNLLSRPFSFPRNLLASEVLSEMKRIYPQKCVYTGDPPLLALVQEGIALAEAYSMKPTRGIALFVLLMFALGHGFAEDPLFPLLSGTLEDPRAIDSDERARRFQAKAAACLNQVLAYHGQG